MVSLEVQLDQLAGELEELAAFSDAPAPAVTRVLFSEQDLAARRYLRGLAEAANLECRADAVGNLFFRLPGADPSLPAVATGSHTDAIPFSGKYDGTVGVLGGLAAMRALQQAGVRPTRSIELIMFTSEEPTRFGLGCLGSRLMAGQLDPTVADEMRDDDGHTLGAVRRAAGYDGPLALVALTAGQYAAFVELHIEQGPLLERARRPIGVVTAIAAPASLRVRYAGPGGHAGAVLMADRADPLLAGAQLALDVEAAALTLGAEDTVATVGVLDVHPRAVNSVPREVRLEIDVRDIDEGRRDQVLGRIRDRATANGAARGVETEVELINADSPAECAENVVAAVEAACSAAQLVCQRMISRAYHDCLFMAQVCPAGMIFIPCRGGVSHRPEEFAAPADIAAGVEVLARTLHQLAEN